MSNSGPPGLLPPKKRKQWRMFMETRRRANRFRGGDRDYVPTRAVPRPDGRYDYVLVVSDEFIMPADRCTNERHQALRRRCDDVTDANAEVNEGFRRFRGAAAAADDEDDAMPVYVAVVAGRIKGSPTAEVAQARPLPLTGEAGAHRPVVVVIDTGIDAAAIDGAGPRANQRRDPWVDRVELAGADPVHLDPLDVVEPLGSLDLGAGHGTFVAGMIAQVSHAARISMIRAFDSDGFASDEDIATAIRRAGAMFPEGRGVLNLSFGIDTIDDAEPAVIRSALASLPEDVVVVAAAGNVATGTPFWPAASPRVLAVGALNDDKGATPAQWSNHGDWVNFSARGEGLSGPFVTGAETEGSGDDDDPFDPEPERFDGPDAYASWAGTSFATAQVSGLVARLLADDPMLSRDDVTTRLRAMGTPSDGHGYRLSIL